MTTPITPPAHHEWQKELTRIKQENRVPHIPQMLLRNVETTKDRCRRVELKNKTLLSNPSNFNPKTIMNPDGTWMRPKLYLKETQPPLNFVDKNDP
jgi:hypothetical protein